VEPERLLLDTGNLRLLERVPQELLETPADQIGTEPIQEQLLEIIHDEPRFKLDSLISSIRSFGFLRNDRLIVARYDGSRMLVLEGNRRLAVVKLLLRNGATESQFVRASMATLPCFVLDGQTISGNEDRLSSYRDLALQYIGVRHLTGIQQWEPASRYEFLARLIEQKKMTPQAVSSEFGQPLSAVLRDYRAHLLYRRFREFEVNLKVKKHRLTYNTFAEVARSPNIREWLGWSDERQEFCDENHIRSFFDYVVKQVGISATNLFGEDEEDEWTPDQSAEALVRKYRDMLKREDPELNSHLEQGDYAKAHELYELRRTGKLEQRLKSYISGLRSVSKSEMQETPATTVRLLQELSDESLDLKSIVEKLVR